MKVLLFGKNGQVGEALQSALQPLGEVVALGRAEADLEQPGELPRVVATHAPDVIVNAAAYTAVDKAETEAERARLVNAEAVATLAAAARRARAWLIHYSTDYVFDGLKPSPYHEFDAAQPLSVYGSTKLRGEQAITESGCRHLLFRVSWVYATGHSNFGATMLRLARDRSSLNVVADQIGAPTSAGLIAAITAKAIGRLAQDDAESLSGTYHLAASGVVSRADYAKFLVNEARAAGAPMALDASGIAAIATADYPTPAARPLNSRLSTRKLTEAFGIDLPPWQDDARQWVIDTVKERRA
jgi:dTDP-4-dehydrorhamnose reductase